MIELTLAQNAPMPATDADCWVVLPAASQNIFPDPLVVGQQLFVNLSADQGSGQQTIAEFPAYVTLGTTTHTGVRFMQAGQVAEFRASRYTEGLAWRLIGGQYTETVEI